MTATESATALDELCVDTIRTLSMDAVQKANSGHPGTPMALAPLAYVLYTRVMRHNPGDPDWIDRDHPSRPPGRIHTSRTAEYRSGSGHVLSYRDYFNQYRQHPEAKAHQHGC